MAPVFFRGEPGLGKRMSNLPDYMVLGGDARDSEVSLLDILDNVLNSGVVIHGNLVISLAGVDLVYVGLNVILTSVETARRNIERAKPARGLLNGRPMQ